MAEFGGPLDRARKLETLIIDARAVLDRTLALFYDSVREHAPLSVKLEDGVRLGSGEFRFSHEFRFDISPFEESGWDVCCGGVILLKQDGELVRSANLWCADRRRSGRHVWIEAAYWHWGGGRAWPPFAALDTTDLRHADLAASNLTHSTQLAYRPQPVTGAHAEEFVRRWSQHLAATSTSSYRRPTRLPEDL